ncbi:MAG: thioether cross-link-forming SCIFF peptide maturase [Peptoniphilus sp. oral taxon 375]|nr:thioether cross-link-forming SCIFF peptide maturase [Peptoniphilus sp. oral taxon 375]
MTSIHKFHLNNQYILLDRPSGSVHVVDPMIYEIIDDIPEKNKSEIINKYKDQYPQEDLSKAIDEIQLLIDQELLFSEDDMELKAPYNPDNTIKAMCLHVAHDCNLRCKYCFASQGDYDDQRLLMDEETGKKALEFLCLHSNNRKNLEVDFFGGEPLMNFDLVKKLVFYGRDLEKKYNKHFRFTITTNGLLLNDENIDFINAHMDNVVLSLDGRKEIHDEMRPTSNGKGSFDLVVENFQKLVAKRKDKDYYIRGTFTNHNLDFSKDVKLFHDLGFEKTSMEPVVAESTQEYAIREEHLDQILKEYEVLSEVYLKIREEDPNFLFFHFMVDLEQGPCAIKRSVGCGAGSEYVAITPTGDIYPCHQFVGETKFRLGNVHTGLTNTEVIENFKCSNVFTKEACQECWAKYYCSGGCHANAYYANGSILEPYKVGCEMEKKRLEAAISILANEG